jgi:YesN/AraC family two-component response regulator
MEHTRALAHFKLLFVEDDAIVCLAIGRMLAKEFPGAEVYTADNGQRGLELFREYAPEIVITDINMPFMTGIEMAEQIKELQPATRFIVLTGYSEKGYLDRFRAIGFYDYIIKPADLDKLFEVIERCYTDSMHLRE